VISATRRKRSFYKKNHGGGDEDPRLLEDMMTCREAVFRICLGSGGGTATVLSAAGAGQVSQAGPGSIRSDVRKAAPLTMKKRMEILFRDKVIERVLMSWAAKAKEV
jgi:hypothetical protein